MALAKFAALPPNATTVGQLLDFLAPEFARCAIAPGWPPDAFAVAASLLLYSGSYLQAITQWPPTGLQREGCLSTDPAEWAARIRQVGHRWRATWPNPVPRQVQRWWRTISRHRDLPLSELGGEKPLCNALLQLCASADEASYGVGYPFGETDSSGIDFFDYMAAAELLPDHKAGSTLCRQIHVSRVRVLPKCHTPQIGITLDSLFHNLTLWLSGDVVPHWYTPLQKDFSDLRHNFNLLVVPWPVVVSPLQFSPADPKGALANMPEGYGFFCFTKKSDPGGLVERLDQLYRKALETAGQIHMVVLPELALDRAEYKRACAWGRRNGLLLLCGVGEPPRNGCAGKNYVALEVLLSGESYVQVEQNKHHRWRLDRSQVVQYGLGGQLDPEVQWWEYSHAEARRLSFVSLLPWLSFCFLVCEDLARQEPVARLVRAVGPNLVIALLMDGPQLSARWPGRYAAVLAEDPGSSVLTMTSIGMVDLCRPAGKPPSRVVALWKDAKSGEAREIELPAGAEGLVLNLTRQKQTEWSADGRSDGGVAGYPILAGVHPIRLDGPKRKVHPRRRQQKRSQPAAT